MKEKISKFFFTAGFIFSGFLFRLTSMSPDGYVRVKDVKWFSLGIISFLLTGLLIQYFPKKKE